MKLLFISKNVLNFIFIGHSFSVIAFTLLLIGGEHSQNDIVDMYDKLLEKKIIFLRSVNKKVVQQLLTKGLCISSETLSCSMFYFKLQHLKR